MSSSTVINMSNNAGQLLAQSTRRRNLKPCGNCSSSQVRCNVSAPYSVLLCERCKRRGLTVCPPYVLRTNGQRRSGRRAQCAEDNSASSIDNSNLQFFVETIPSTSGLQPALGDTAYPAVLTKNDVEEPREKITSQTVADVQFLPIGLGGTVSNGDLANRNELKVDYIASSSASTSDNSNNSSSCAVVGHAFPVDLHQGFTGMDSNWLGFLDDALNEDVLTNF